MRKPRHPVMCRAERIISSTPLEAQVLALGKRSDTTTHTNIWERERSCAAAGRFADFVAWQRGSSFALVLVFKKKGIISSAESRDQDVWKWERSPSIGEMRKAYDSYGKGKSSCPEVHRNAEVTAFLESGHSTHFHCQQSSRSYQVLQNYGKRLSPCMLFDPWLICSTRYSQGDICRTQIWHLYYSMCKTLNGFLSSLRPKSLTQTVRS